MKLKVLSLQDCEQVRQWRNEKGKANTKEITWAVDDTGCWICTSHSLSRGYPQHMIDGKNKRVSRTIYEKYKEPIPEGLFVCHS